MENLAVPAVFRKSSHMCAVERTIGSMIGQIERQPRLRELAGAHGLSVFHFTRVFRRITGVPPLRFMAAWRIRIAQRLLLSSDLSVTDVSLSVGYSSVGSFVRRFSEQVGVPPTGFRAAARRIASIWPPPPALGARDSGPGTGPVISGHLRIAPGIPFEGLIVTGLFASPLPHGLPLACDFHSGPGPFQLTAPADGQYFVFALGFPHGADPVEVMLHDLSIRGAGVPSPVISGAGRSRPVIITLRPPLLIDPPILLAVPLLFRETTAKPPSGSA